MSNADILKAAKQLLIDKTWVQGDELACGGSKRNCFCAATAIGESLTDAHGARVYSNDHPLFDLFRVAAGIGKLDSIGTWNDAPERTKDDVLAAFDKAIALAEQVQGAGVGQCATIPGASAKGEAS